MEYSHCCNVIFDIHSLSCHKPANSFFRFITDKLFYILPLHWKATNDMIQLLRPKDSLGPNRVKEDRGEKQ